MGPTPTGPILMLVHRARARIRIQRILDAACTALIPASGLALVGTHVTLAGVGGGLAILVAAGGPRVAAYAGAAGDIPPHLGWHLGLARLRLATAWMQLYRLWQQGGLSGSRYAGFDSLASAILAQALDQFEDQP